MNPPKKTVGNSSFTLEFAAQALESEHCSSSLSFVSKSQFLVFMLQSNGINNSVAVNVKHVCHQF